MAEEAQTREVPPPRRIFTRIPLAVVAFSLFLGALHIAPPIRAYLAAPEGWEFTWNQSGSPDALTYRVFARRAQQTGVLVDNRFTEIENEPHVPMLFYYLTGKTAQLTGTSPDFVVTHAGTLFAFVLGLLLWTTIRHFSKSAYQSWWVLVVIVFGGGLGAHLKELVRIEALRDSFIVDRVVLGGLENAIVFEDYRNHYVLNTLFDSHFLFFLILALLAVIALYNAVRRETVAAIALAAFMFGFVTFAHIYDGVTLLAIAYGVAFLFWAKGLPVRTALLAACACTVAVGGVVAWQISLYSGTGVPVPDWRAPTILFSELLLAYPIAWLLMAFGLGAYWRKAGPDEVFLLGWVLGCVLLTLAGPFYPYSDRGVLTLQIAAYVVAGGIFFARHARVSWPMALVAVCVLGLAPYQHSKLIRMNSRFTDTKPYRFASLEHIAMIDAMKRAADESDLLMSDKTAPAWKTDDLWIGPHFPGKLYAGHYALTVDYDRKQAEVSRFFHGDGPEAQRAYLADTGVTFLYVAAEAEPSRFEAIPGLEPLHRAPFGTLFTFDADAGPRPTGGAADSPGPLQSDASASEGQG